MEAEGSDSRVFLVWGLRNHVRVVCYTLKFRGLFENFAEIVLITAR